MKQPLRPGLCCATGLLTAMLGFPALLHAQVSPPPPAPAPRSDRVGLDLFGGASVSFPAAQDSFEAVGLKTTAFEFGGGVRVTGLWRRLFLQVAANHWSDGGERAFVASDGTVFPLGILLDVKATFVDATIGVKDVVRSSSGRISYLHYFGAGAGAVRYRESSAFAEPGDDLDITEPSYHVLAGAEVPIAGPLAVAVDGRYRYIPNVLGDGGASSVLDEDSLGGFQLSVALRLGLGGPRALRASTSTHSTGRGSEAADPTSGPLPDGGDRRGGTGVPPARRDAHSTPYARGGDERQGAGRERELDPRRVQRRAVRTPGGLCGAAFCRGA